MPRKRQLRPLDTDPTVYQIVAFDVEGTGDDGGFVCGTIYDDDGPHEYSDRSRMCAALLTHRYRSALIFAHNLEYDWGCLFQDAFVGWSLYRLESHLIRAEYRDREKHIWRFWDTANLSAFQSIGALGKILGYDKLDTPEWLVGPALMDTFGSGLSPAQWSEVKRYCTRDAEICYRYASHIQAAVNHLGGELKTTLASTAMDLFRRAHLTHAYDTPHPLVNELSREAYYGGRTEVYVYGQSEDCYQYDVHSMYPSVMLGHRYPDPTGMFRLLNTCHERNIERREGITCATIVAPDMHYPVLPYRVSQRLVFPTGRMQGAWTHPELRYALSLGYRIEDIHWQVIARRTCNPFASYVDQLYRLKQSAGQTGDPAYFVYKILLNSLYGKFAQRNDDSFTVVEEIDDAKEFVESVGIKFHLWGNRVVKESPLCEDKQPEYIVVIWPAYVTSYARIVVHRQLMRTQGTAVYTDTDCCVSPMQLEDNAHLGSWGLEYGPTTFQFRAEKYYRVLREHGEWIYKKAGIPKEQQADFWYHGSTTYRRPSKLLESIVRNGRLSVWMKQTKVDQHRHLKRCPDLWSWDDTQTVHTRPWTVDEAELYYSNAPHLPPWRRFGNLDPPEIERREMAFLDMWAD